MKGAWAIFLIFVLLIFGAWYAVFRWGGKLEQRWHTPPPDEQAGLEISPDHPQYWRFKGRDVMLLGGSVEDNLFQIADLGAHLDLLQSCGGNYVRNTMSSRDSGNVWPFHLQADGMYDLDRWNEEYWKRFSRFLEATASRDIIVQLEVWATFDFYREPWLRNPYNPRNTRTYSAERVRLPIEVPTHPTRHDNNFFLSVPSREHNIVLLGYQQKFVDKLLEHSLPYGHVLYCMDNETSVTSEWGKFWALYIRQKALEAGKTVHTTEMWDPWDLDHITHRETTDHPELYSFVDISQNNHNSGDRHWENGLQQIGRLRALGTLRPVNNVKVYGNDGGPHQTTRNGVECFVRNVLMGAASTRFHRPPTGQGLNETAQAVIRGMRSLVEKTDFFQAAPANELLGERDAHEAYCRALPGREYTVYFPDGGEVLLDLSRMHGRATISWLQVESAQWRDAGTTSGGQVHSLPAPGSGHWLALIKRQ
jgi:hypothetical protein